VQVRGAHEAFIDEETWQRYLRERERRRGLPPKSRQPRWALGGGLCVCGRCGARLAANTYKNGVKSQAVCSAYRTARTCPGVWITRVRLETLVALWLGGRVREWADRQEEAAGIDDERAVLLKDLDAARAEEDRLGRGRANAARLLALGEVDEDDYREARAAADEARREVAGRVADLEARLDALAPDADVFERLARSEGIYGGGGADPQAWSVLLRKIIRRVEVGPDTVTLTPWRGEARTWDRSVVTPRRPARARETAHGPDGRFVRSS